MALRRGGIVAIVLAVFVGVAYVGQDLEPSGVKMATAANAFLQTLTPEQKTQAAFAFDDKERLNWHFVPLQDAQKQPTRKGLPLERMNDQQRKAALDLLRAGTSSDGFQRATQIMSLEAILNELEKGGRIVRSPDWYFFSIFGTPGKTGQWGWRVEGHHLSLNFTIENGKVVSSTPIFLGANPATVIHEGPRKNLRTLAEAEDLAKELFKSLDETQRRVAQQSKHFPEVKAQNARPEVGEPIGLPASKMTEKQQNLLRELLREYARSLPGDAAELELSRVHQGGLGGIHFAFSGGAEPRQERTYRVHGPTFVIEFLNIQADSAGNKANHIHTCFRRLSGDFGLAAK